MTLGSAILSPWCKGPSGLCDVAQKDCLKCNSVNRDNALRAVKREREDKFLSLLFWGKR